MARDVSPIVKQSRREGYALHPKAHKIMARKSGIPGVHAHGRQGKPSEQDRAVRGTGEARGPGEMSQGNSERGEKKSAQME